MVSATLGTARLFSIAVALVTLLACGRPSSAARDDTTATAVDSSLDASAQVSAPALIDAPDPSVAAGDAPALDALGACVTVVVDVASHVATVDGVVAANDVDLARLVKAKLAVGPRAFCVGVTGPRVYPRLNQVITVMRAAGATRIDTSVPDWL